MESEQLQRAIEAILFAAGERIDIGRLAAALETDASLSLIHISEPTRP